MPRAPRLQLAGASYHVTSHGVRDYDVYRDDDDLKTFSAIVGGLMRRRRWTCTGYCFMTNHFHLVVTTADPDLAAGIQWLNGTYAASFNQKYGERGHLFRERYRSRVVQTEAHFLELYSYLALNPVKARMVDRPEGLCVEQLLGAARRPPGSAVPLRRSCPGAPRSHRRGGARCPAGHRRRPPLGARAAPRRLTPSLRGLTPDRGVRA